MQNETYETTTQIEVTKDSLIQALYLTVITLQNKVEDLTTTINDLKKPKMLDINDIIDFYHCNKKTAYNVIHDPDLNIFDKGHKYLVLDTELYKYATTKRSPASIRYWNEIENKKAIKKAKKGE